MKPASKNEKKLNIYLSIIFTRPAPRLPYQYERFVSNNILFIFIFGMMASDFVFDRSPLLIEKSYNPDSIHFYINLFFTIIIISCISNQNIRIVTNKPLNIRPTTELHMTWLCF